MSLHRTNIIGDQSHAIVIGGSIGGMLAARVLTEHFDVVTIIDRDIAPETAENRKGVPQGRHVHFLLARGASIIDNLFPGFFQELQSQGSICTDYSEISWYHYGVWKARVKTDIPVYLQSRSFLEWHIRRRLATYKNVRLLYQCNVDDLIFDEENRRITGVRIQHRAEEDRIEELKADLVVDASGRGSRTPQWLEKMGYSKPEKTEIKINLAYATRLYKRPKDTERNWLVMSVFPKAPQTRRGGMVTPIEGDRWLVTIAGGLGDHPPDDEAAYLEFARNLEIPNIYEAIKHAEPLTPISKYKFPSTIRCHYEKMQNFPENYLVFGDAICSFNPFYGQGMSVCAMYAEVLEQCLSEYKIHSGKNFGNLYQQYFRKISKVIDIPWALATGEDFRYPQTEGKRSRLNGFLNWYTARIFELSAHDPIVVSKFFQVMHLQKPPTILFHPYVVWQVLKQGVGLDRKLQPSTK